MADRKIYFAIICFAILLFAGGFFVFPEIFKSKKISIVQPQKESTAIIENEEKVKSEIIPEENMAENVKPADNPKSEETPQDKSNEEAAPKEKANGISITNRYVSWGFEKASSRKIDTVIIHSSYDLLGDDPYSTSGLISEYKQYGVAPHYLIDRKGNIYRLVTEKNIAYHAGESEVPDGRTSVNNFSIGIELMNKEDGKFTNEQYDSLNKLLKDLKSRYIIKYVLGHSQIAPGRKTDPWNFDWKKISE